MFGISKIKYKFTTTNNLSIIKNLNTCETTKLLVFVLILC